MYTRRQALAIGAIGVGGLSGCTDLASSDGPITREASPAGVDSAVLEETEYEFEEQREKTLSREVSAAGETRKIEATNYATLYAKTLGDGETDGSLFGVVSTPAFEFVGQSFNPIADADNEKILSFVAGEFGEVTVNESVAESTQTVLGTETTVTKFDAEAEFNGERIPVYVFVTSVQHEEDIIVGAGAYPQELDDTEADKITQLLDGIQHPFDAESE